MNLMGRNISYEPDGKEGRYRMNPMEMMQFAKDIESFKQNHPKVAKFLAIEFSKGLPEGSILELKIIRPGEEERISNMRVLPEDRNLANRFKKN